MENFKKYLAEFFATFFLVVIGCGTAIATGADVVATAAAFGMSIVILAYSVGRISGGHANPAVSLAMAIRGDISWKDFALYSVSQICGAFVGSAVLGAMFGSFDATGANRLVPVDSTGVAMLLSFVVEIVLTFVFLMAILGVTSDDKFAGFGGLVIGLALFGVHLVGINLTGTSVNPARALSASVFALFGSNADAKALMLGLIPAFFAPFIGAALAAFCWKFFAGKKEKAE